MESKEYRCTECANAGTPYCDNCHSIASPSGRKSKPSNYIQRGPIFYIHGGRETQLQRMVAYVKYCIDNTEPIPIKVVEEYNKKLNSELRIQNSE